MAGRAEMSAEELRADRQIAHEQRTAEGVRRRKALKAAKQKERREARQREAEAGGSSGNGGRGVDLGEVDE